jgi:uncharacterized protein (TIGR04255 family)
VASTQSPPVNEVVLAVGFEPEKLLSGPMLPELLGSWFAERGSVEVAPPYIMPTESELGSTAWSTGAKQLQLREAALNPRYWIISRDSEYVIQAQPDYLALNWRREETNRPYVHYEALRSRFDRVVTTVRGNLARYDRDLTPLKAEITYVNIIAPNELWSDLSEVGRVFSFDIPETEFEQLAVNFSIRMTMQDGSFAGRVHVALQPGIDLRKGEPRLSHTITVRSSELNADDPQAFMSFLDDAHNVANATFVQSLTPEALSYWGIR